MIISIDTETTGLEETDRPFCATISGEGFDIYTESPELAQQYVNAADRIFLQNSKFDARMLAHWGINIFAKPTYDCAFMSRILRNDHMQYNLAAQAKRAGMEKSTAVDKAIKEGKHYEVRKDFFGVEYKVPRYDRVDREVLKKYALLDSSITYKLGTSYMKQADAKDLSLMEMESKLTPVCYAMERRGLLLNMQYTLDGYYYETGKLNGYLVNWKAATGKNFTNSAKSVQAHLSVQLPTTEEGNPSLTDDVIEQLLSCATDSDRNLLNTVRDIRTYQKRINTYYESYLNKADSSGVIHPTMWQAGTRTGRFSYSDPNLQNIPKEEGSEEKYVIRGCFRPRPGYQFISMDFSQMEYRMMADYAGEKEVIAAVMAGKDFHQVTADMFGVSRKYAKTLNFAILYGAGTDKIASMLGVSKEEANRLKTRYFMALPKVERLVDDVIAVGRGRGHVNNWYGRKLYAEKEFCYALPNHLIQGGGADVVKIAMVRIDELLRGTDVHMVLQIHDQLVFEYPLGMDNTLLKEIKNIMEDVYEAKNGIRLTVDVSYSGKSLAERDMKKMEASWI